MVAFLLTGARETATASSSRRHRDCELGVRREDSPGYLTTNSHLPAARASSTYLSTQSIARTYTYSDILRTLFCPHHTVGYFGRYWRYVETNRRTEPDPTAHMAAAKSSVLSQPCPIEVGAGRIMAQWCDPAGTVKAGERHESRRAACINRPQLERAWGRRGQVPLPGRDVVGCSRAVAVAVSHVDRRRAGRARRSRLGSTES
jgi:hypothetical protein